MKLPFHNRLIQCFPDAMHTIQDVVEHIFNLITGREDSAKVRASEAGVNRFGISGSTATKRTREGAGVRKEVLPKVPFRLSADEVKVANACGSTVSVPARDFTPGAVFSRTTGHVKGSPQVIKP